MSDKDEQSTRDAVLIEQPDDRRELLRVAVQEGYFRVPREVTLTDLAERSGRSSKEVSEELRRAIEEVVLDTMADD
ncbi:helix-turn-helix domain-containing protein [Haloarchaeobius sp. TZWSO28]|uniref:helix-turn-helix domain-containing protein n=1 Tax=Haloarchaeobius sp. TZWSO28 TaxID=3446119 RepID=UPI003EB9CB3D